MPEVLTYICPFCECEARVGKLCPGCVKKSKKPKPKKRSWAQNKSEDGLDLPGGNFDYDDFIAREFGRVPHRKIGLKWYWWALAVALLALMISGVIWIG